VKNNLLVFSIMQVLFGAQKYDSAHDVAGSLGQGLSEFLFWQMESARF
jgi:hypothetical protein